MEKAIKKVSKGAKKNAKSNKTYYVTTPIYYPSGKWHIGHCYTTVCCDALARFKRLDGYDVFYLTGTDEHGQKIMDVAKSEGVTPQALVDERCENIKKLWERLDISYDKFIRTTDAYHEKAVQKIFDTLYEKGDIYKSTYHGKYCKPCESFWTDGQLIDGKCPDCGREVTEAEEESYFFRLSKYGDRLKALLTNGEFLQPQSRVNEMVNNFIDKGLEDIAVSRTSFDWGVPVSFDKKHVIYVWIDALSNYITALGYGGGDDTLFKKYWPCDLHVMAKEIVRFHSLIWPALLMALDLPLPKKVYGHGWIMFDGDKMSKSKGNVVDPFVLIDRYGSDSLRYYLLREIPFGADSDYTAEALLNRINTGLVNDYGNLVRRTLAMCKQYYDGAITKRVDEADKDIIAAINDLYGQVKENMDKPIINRALEAIFDVVGKLNKYIDETKPWVLFKEKDDRLMSVLYTLVEGLRVCTTLLMPFITQYPNVLFDALGIPVPKDFTQCVFGAVESYKTSEAQVFMNRLDIAKELDALKKIAMKDEDGADEKSPAGDKSGANDKAKKSGADKAKSEKGEVTIDEFFKTKLIVVTIKTCEKVEKTEKLLHLTVDDGERIRDVVSGIAMSYEPQDLIGKQAVLVANLQPAVIRKIKSEGMLLCAMKDGKPVLIAPSAVTDAGSEVC